ncbi:MAG TPA: phosphoethanolamine--lipid A transferase [Povalibacter sp.]|nr:phosphoethanolamine--lipid A transferase [Povalibacter sp.]
MRAIATLRGFLPSWTVPVALLRPAAPWKAVTCRSEVHFAVGTALLWLLIYNGGFWSQTLQAMWHPTLHSALFLVSLFILTLTVQSLLLLILPSQWLMRAVASLLFVVAAASAYFCSTYGAVMNQDMMRNVLQTDPAEVGALLSIKLVFYIVVLGLLPAVLVWRVQITPASVATRLRQRAIYIVAALAVSAAGLFATSADYAVFFREHKPIRYALLPAAPTASLVELLTHKERVSGPLLNPAGRSERLVAAHARPTVMFLVVGETARAANFSLGGYARPTNPRLQQVPDLVYFDHVTSCGTATATSLPCMFSSFPRTEFQVDDSYRYRNLLDALTDAGLDVEWRDNDSGCKGVCARVRTVSYAHDKDPGECQHANCYDTVMLQDLPQRLREITSDTIIVFHQIGSHGPAYSERYPAATAPFQPACSSNELQKCTHEEVVNAYDNTIAQTDAFLAQQIELLQKASDRVNGILLYVSDHGESLGENGVYLHGLPYAFAPRVQKEIPMLLWTSGGFRKDEGLSNECLRAHRNEPLSHDNLYHTVLGALRTKNAIYDPQLDVLAQCRTGGVSADNQTAKAQSLAKS